MFTKIRAMKELFTMWPKILQSKTIIVNVTTLVVAVATTLLNLEFVQQHAEITAFLATTLIPTANIILRFFTNSSVSEKKGLFK